MTPVLFINQTDLKAYTPVSSNLDMIWLNSVFERVQVQYIKPVLCEELYDELITQILSSTVSQANRLLLAQVAPAMAWYVVYKGLPYIQMRIEPKGVRVNTDAHSNAPSAGEMQTLMNANQENAIFYLNQLSEFLRDNASDYPLWKNCNCGETGAYNSGIYLG